MLKINVATKLYDRKSSVLSYPMKNAPCTFFDVFQEFPVKRGSGGVFITQSNNKNGAFTKSAANSFRKRSILDI